MEDKKQETVKTEKHNDAKIVLDKTKKKNGASKKEPNKKNNSVKTSGKQNDSKNLKQHTETKHKSEDKQQDFKKPEKVSLDKKKTTDKQSDKKDQKPKRKPNILLWVTIVIIAIPCLILAYILIGSREGATSPVVGSRFDHALDPEITDENINALKESLQLEGAESIEINLKSATLRITINTRDDMNQEEIKNLLVSAYDKVNEQLPITTYFTNKTSGEGEDQTIIKMYDLEISAYNFIPTTDEEKNNQIHLSRTKNAATAEVVDDVLSSPKDEETANEILHPDTSNPPTQAENEGE